MKIGFIKKIGSDSEAIITMYNGENASFNNKDYQYKFFKSDIIVFNLKNEEPENIAINIKNVKDCTLELINSKNTFRENEWYLIIKGNKDIFLEYVHKEVKKNNFKKFLSLKKKVYDLTPIIMELISSYKISIAEWHHYKAGDDSSCGVVMHSHFNSTINSNLVNLISNLNKVFFDFYQPINIYKNESLNPTYSQVSFKQNNVHVGRIHFTSVYLKSFFPVVGKSLYYDPSYRYINESYKSDLKNWKKIHKDAEKLEKKMQIKLKTEYSPIALFKEITVKFNYKLPSNEEQNIIHYEETVNKFIEEWDYINTFDKKKYCYTPKLNFKYTGYDDFYLKNSE
ncbi:MAG: hypothetical protein V4698_03490 [Bacteroidota bacterium]